MKDDDRLLLS